MIGEIVGDSRFKSRQVMLMEQSLVNSQTGGALDDGRAGEL